MLLGAALLRGMGDARAGAESDLHETTTPHRQPQHKKPARLDVIAQPFFTKVLNTGIDRKKWVTGTSRQGPTC